MSFFTTLLLCMVGSIPILLILGWYNANFGWTYHHGFTNWERDRLAKWLLQILYRIGLISGD